MPINTFLEKTDSDAENISFEETVHLIDKYYDYTPTGFSNGRGNDLVVNSAGSNEGSCRIFAFAKLNKLGKEQTLACFGKYYREDVLNNPQGNDHANIRTFMRHGWANIHFDGTALTKK